jgi:hypothetical protein
MKFNKTKAETDAMCCLCLCDKGKSAKAASSAQGVSDEM